MFAGVFSIMVAVSETWSIVITIAILAAILLVYAAVWVWLMITGHKPFLVCRECREGRMAETGEKEKGKVWGCLYHREYQCQHCGHKAWHGDLYRYLRGHLDVEPCPECGNATMNSTGVKKRRLLYQIREYECIHCGHKIQD